MKIFPNILHIAEAFEGILLDAYGVFWNGNEVGLLPHSVEAMKQLVDSGKVVGILSNATALASKEIDKLARHGLILGKHFHFLITSGEVAKRIFLNQTLPFPTPNRKYWLFHDPHPKTQTHRDIFSGTQYLQAENIQDADFIYIPVPHLEGQDQINPELFRSRVEKIKMCGLPMVCINPDKFAHEGNPPRPVVRDGTIATYYEEFGGNAFYIGKPSSLAFSAAMQEFQIRNIDSPEKILMVGDTPETDIQGANHFGMSSALITQTGMMAHRIDQWGLDSALNKLAAKEYPKFFIERLGSP